MINIYILFSGLVITIIEIITGFKLLMKKDGKGAPLIFHGGVLMFAVVFLSVSNNIDLKDNIPFIVFICLFYISTLVWLCSKTILEKKNALYLQEQEKIDNWK